MPTRIYHHPVFAEHMTGPGHAERPERMEAVAKALSDPAFASFERTLAPEGSVEAVYRCHSEQHVRRIAKSIPASGTLRIEADTVVSPKSFEAALRAVGAACAAVDDVVEGRADNVFVASRPPGHHATPEEAMGFCLFNAAAIAARHAQATHGIERVAIVDWDVHHGNGTQDIFWNDPTVLFASTHEMPLYPGTGAKTETGTANNIVNAPLSAGDGGEAFRDAFETRVLPALEAFRPDLVIVSAGFDAHHRDPLANLRFVEDDYDWATGRLMGIADRLAGGRLVSLLEGGYDLVGLERSVAAHVARLGHG
ncbi:histone deacetylase family protein [Aureimonas leprariae]|uniref:Histone deacetylase family protein n=1 Tax=Plantimonas leprariae TaxID=2615207 RepID=A0A7V7PQ98_9HYPH|nr:histone deacetylase family protein [Aureimonas leprariae]KAB0680287.1 histone deacetylase family protein [Aureimonas leprariae]